MDQGSGAPQASLVKMAVSTPCINSAANCTPRVVISGNYNDNDNSNSETKLLGRTPEWKAHRSTILTLVFNGLFRDQKQQTPSHSRAVRVGIAIVSTTTMCWQRDKKPDKSLATDRKPGSSLVAPPGLDSSAADSPLPNPEAGQIAKFKCCIQRRLQSKLGFRNNFASHNEAYAFSQETSEMI